MNQTAQRHDDTFEKLAIAALFVFIGLLTVVWAGAQLATVLAHGHPLQTTFEEAGKAMLAMKDHMGDPRKAWLPEQREQLPGPVLYWAATAVAAFAGIGVAYVAWKVFRDPTESLDQRRRAGVSAQGRLAKPKAATRPRRDAQRPLSARPSSGSSRPASPSTRPCSW